MDVITFISIGSCLIILFSFLIREMTGLRLTNIVLGSIFVLYGLISNVYTISLLNLLIVSINSYSIVKEFKIS